MIGRTLRGLGLRDWQLHTSSLASVLLCLALWIRAKTVDQTSRANAERRAIFVGLWPPMFWLLGDAVERARPAAPLHPHEGRRAGSRALRRATRAVKRR